MPFTHFNKTETSFHVNTTCLGFESFLYFYYLEKWTRRSITELVKLAIFARVLQVDERIFLQFLGEIYFCFVLNTSDKTVPCVFGRLQCQGIYISMCCLVFSLCWSVYSSTSPKNKNLVLGIHQNSKLEALSQQNILHRILQYILTLILSLDKYHQSDRFPIVKTNLLPVWVLL